MKKVWTEEEMTRLINLALICKKNGRILWKEISKQLVGTTPD